MSAPPSRWLQSQAAVPSAVQRVEPIIALYVIFVGLVFFTLSLRSDVPDHGDYVTDRVLIQAAHSLDKTGFWKLKFALTLDESHEVGRPPTYRVRWPVFPTDVLALAFRVGLPVRAARLVPLLVSATALFALFLMLLRLGACREFALIACIALASFAPFRLLSDAFSYESYDFAWKFWTLYAITRAALSGNRTPWLALTAATAAGYTLLSSVEHVPTLLVCGLGVPLAIVDGGWRKRVTSALAVGGSVFGGLSAGWLVHCGYISWVLGIDVATLPRWYVANAASRFAHAATTVLWHGTFLREWLHRLLAYTPVQLALLALSVALFGLPRLAAKAAMDISPRVVRLIPIYLVGELGWILAVRGHSHLHVHTVGHLAGSMCLAVAVSCYLLLRWCRRRSLTWHTACMTSLAAVLIFELSGLGTRAYGNLATRFLHGTEGMSRYMSKLMPEDAVFVDTVNGRSEESDIRFFIAQTALSAPPDGVPQSLIASGRPLFIYRDVREPVGGAMRESDLTLVARFAFGGTALFRHVGSSRPEAPSPLEVVCNFAECYTGFRLHPEAQHPDLLDRYVLRRIELMSAASSDLVFRVSQAESQVASSDGVGLSFFALGPDGRQSLLRRIVTDPARILSLHWVRVSVPKPPSDVRSLVVVIDPGPAMNPNFDWTMVSPDFACR